MIFMLAVPENSEKAYYSQVISLSYTPSNVGKSLLTLPDSIAGGLEEILWHYEEMRPFGFYVDTISGSLSYTVYRGFYGVDAKKIKVKDFDKIFMDQMEIKDILKKSDKNNYTHVECGNADDGNGIFLDSKRSLKIEVVTDTLDKSGRDKLRILFFAKVKNDWKQYNNVIVEDDLQTTLSCVGLVKTKGSKYPIIHILTELDWMANRSLKEYLILPSSTNKETKILYSKIQ